MRAHKIYKVEIRKASRAKRKASRAKRKGSPEAEGLDEPEVVELDWKERLLDLLLGMSPDAFERLGALPQAH